MSAAALLADLRRRIHLLERRPPTAAPHLPPHAPGFKTRSLADIPGARLSAFGATVTSVYDVDALVGHVAPSTALSATPALAAELAGLEEDAPVLAPANLLSGLRILDVETTGLAGGTGTLAFVIGLGMFDVTGALVVEQLILGGPGDEPAMLDHLLARLATGTLLVTFNGRSFDAPLLRTRCILSRRPPGPLSALPHLDLLPASRRLWRDRALDCRLVTLEDRVLGRRRVDDLPGSMAPAAYSGYLRAGEIQPLADIVVHNREDIAGTAALLAAVLRTHGDPLLWAEDAGELLGVAEHRLRRGAADSALAILERALAIARNPSQRRRALVQMARLHRRARRFDAARAAWEGYRREFPSENLGYSELAKLLEHRARDVAAALAVAQAAPHPGAEDVTRRLIRLRRRVSSAKLTL